MQNLFPVFSNVLFGKQKDTPSGNDMFVQSVHIFELPFYPSKLKGWHWSAKQIGRDPQQEQLYLHKLSRERKDGDK